jgi:hypothetical protein
MNEAIDYADEVERCDHQLLVVGLNGQLEHHAIAIDEETGLFVAFDGVYSATPYLSLSPETAGAASVACGSSIA